MSDIPIKRTERKKYFEATTKEVNVFLRLQEKKNKEEIPYAIYSQEKEKKKGRKDV